MVQTIPGPAAAVAKLTIPAKAALADLAAAVQDLEATEATPAEQD